MDRVVREVQEWKAYWPMLVTEVGMEREASETQNSRPLLPMESTEVGMESVVRREQL